jgi:hypothetical protein
MTSRALRKRFGNIVQFPTSTPKPPKAPRKPRQKKAAAKSVPASQWATRPLGFTPTLRIPEIRDRMHMTADQFARYADWLALQPPHIQAQQFLSVTLARTFSKELHEVALHTWRKEKVMKSNPTSRRVTAADKAKMDQLRRDNPTWSQAMIVAACATDEGSFLPARASEHLGGKRGQKPRNP